MRAAERRRDNVTENAMIATLNNMLGLATAAALLIAAGTASAAPVAKYEAKTVGYGGNRTMVVFARKVPAVVERPYALTGVAARFELRYAGIGGNRTTPLFVRVDR
jgi:hypothetical protein